MKAIVVVDKIGIGKDGNYYYLPGDLNILKKRPWVK